MPPAEDPKPHYEVEFKAFHATRPGFRINELRLSPTPLATAANAAPTPPVKAA